MYEPVAASDVQSVPYVRGGRAGMSWLKEQAERAAREVNGIDSPFNARIVDAIERVANEHASMVLRQAIAQGTVKVIMPPDPLPWPAEVAALIHSSYERGYQDGRARERGFK